MSQENDELDLGDGYISGVDRDNLRCTPENERDGLEGGFIREHTEDIILSIARKDMEENSPDEQELQEPQRTPEKENQQDSAEDSDEETESPADVNPSENRRERAPPVEPIRPDRFASLPLNVQTKLTEFWEKAPESIRMFDILMENTPSACMDITEEQQKLMFARSKCFTVLPPGDIYVGPSDGFSYCFIQPCMTGIPR